MFGALIFLRMHPENLLSILWLNIVRQALLWEAFFVDCLGLGHSVFGDVKQPGQLMSTRLSWVSLRVAEGGIHVIHRDTSISFPTRHGNLNQYPRHFISIIYIHSLIYGIVQYISILINDNTCIPLAIILNCNKWSLSRGRLPSRRPAASPCSLATGAGAGRSGLQPGAGAWKLDQGSGWVRRESQEQGIYI